MDDRIDLFEFRDHLAQTVEGYKPPPEVIQTPKEQSPPTRRPKPRHLPSTTVLPSIIDPQVLKLIRYWNQFDGVQKLKLHDKYRKVLIEDQTISVQTVCKIISEIEKGCFYEQFKEIPLSASGPIALSEISTIIEAVLPDISEAFLSKQTQYKMSLVTFFYSERAPLIRRNKDKKITKANVTIEDYLYRYKFPFLHYYLHRGETVYKRKTKYAHLVDRLCVLLKAPNSNKVYNKLVLAVERCVTIIQRNRIIQGYDAITAIPKLLQEILIEKNKVGAEYVQLAAYLFEQKLREKSIIR